MTYFLRSGTHFNVSTKAALDLHEELPVGTYTVKYDEMRGVFYLEQIEGFSISGKSYGDTGRNSQRILNTFHDREGSTGVMLTGEKGSGKTRLAKVLSVEGQKLGIPTIVINNDWAGEGFNVFMQMIEQPTIVIFDEFEKVYDREQQEKMLTLLDGVYPSKKLYVITCNDKWRVNEHMRNRPGRIYYRFDYTGLDQEFITEYCEDNLLNKDHIDALCRIAVIFAEFNFDMLKAMVEEMNRYNESPQEVMRVLNAKPEFSDSKLYRVALSVKDVPIADDKLHENEWRGNPLNGDIRLHYTKPGKDDDDEDSGWTIATFHVSDLSKVDAETGKFHFTNAKGEQLTLIRVEAKMMNWDAF